MKHSEHQFSEKSSRRTQSLNSVREHSVPQIPDDLLVEIFSRVPRKSVARFRCVSKHWAFILRRSDFTELFLTKSLTRPMLLFTVKANGKLLLYSSPQPHNPDDNSSLVASPYYTYFPKYLPSDICSTVCGLVLLQGWKRKVPAICNPATGEFLTLPKVLLKEKNLPKVKAKSNPTEIAKMYLGYDPVGKQFKVLCLTSSRDEREIPTTHQVLTLESGKRVWRRVEGKFPYLKRRRVSGEICIEGVLYFGQCSKIFCFNVRSENFSFINTREDMQYPYVFGSSTLFNYKGKLGIYNLLGTKLVLWVLEDAGNHKWSKHNYVLSPLEYDKIVGGKVFVRMTSRGEIVYLWHSCVSLYNLESNTVKRVNIQGLEGLGHPSICGTFLDYVENMKFI